MCIDGSEILYIYILVFTRKIDVIPCDNVFHRKQTWTHARPVATTSLRVHARTHDRIITSPNGFQSVFQQYVRRTVQN